MQLIQAKIIFPAGKVFPSQYGGDRQNIKVLFPSGEERCIWFKAGQYPHLRKGQDVQVIVDDQGHYKIIDDSATAAPPTPTAPTAPKAAPTAPTPDQLQKYVELISGLFRFCLAKTQHDFPELSEESQLAIADKLFQQTVKKFGV